MAEETSPERVRTHSSRHSTRHHRHTRSHKVLLLYLGLAFLLLTVLGLSIRLGMYARDNARLVAMEQTQAAHLAQQEQEMAVLRGELAALVEERLPRLSPIVLDEVIPINEHYVRNVMFMMTRKQKEQRYEYTLVMDNSTVQHRYPEVKIMLFDRAGIQVGVSTVGYDNQGRPNQDVLERGEIRTHSSFVQIFDESPPEYYLIQVNAS
jgi:hypothetical protein